MFYTNVNETPQRGFLGKQKEINKRVALREDMFQGSDSPKDITSRILDNIQKESHMKSAH